MQVKAQKEPRHLPWLAKKALIIVPAKRREEFEYELRWYYEEHGRTERPLWLHLQVLRAFWYETPQYVRAIAKTLTWLVVRWISR